MSDETSTAAPYGDRDRLIDGLRFGPMALYMRDWTEPVRKRLCEQIADELILTGWRKHDPPEQPQHHIGIFRVNPETGECGCECFRCWRDDTCRCVDCTATFHDHSKRVTVGG